MAILAGAFSWNPETIRKLSKQDFIFWLDRANDWAKTQTGK